MGKPRPLSFGRYDYAAFLTFFSYAAGSVVIPVSLVTVALELGFSLEEGGLAAGGGLHLGRTLAMVLAMLLTGFAAGHWGTRPTLGTSVLLMSGGLFLCASAPQYSILFLALLIAGLGEGVIEGLATPFVQNLHPQSPGRYINITHAFWSVGVFCTVLLAGWLLTTGTSWRTLTFVVAMGSALAALLILIPNRTQPYPEPSERMHWRSTWRGVCKICRTPKFWIFYAAMFLAGGGEFALTFWIASHIQLHFGGSSWSGGLGVAIFALAMVIGRMACGYYVPQHRLGQLVVVAGIFGAFATLWLPSTNNLLLLYGLLFAAGLATAPFWPSIQSHASDQLPESNHTLLLILLSCAGVPGCGFFAYGMGYLGNYFGSLTVGFYVVPIAYIAIAALLSLSKTRTNALSS
jgi:MFS family permease